MLCLEVPGSTPLNAVWDLSTNLSLTRQEENRQEITYESY